MNIAKAKHRERLSKAIENSHRNLQSYRMSRKDLIRRYIGTDGGRRSYDGGKARLPQVNSMHQVAEAYQTALSFNLPQYRVDSKIGSFRSFAQRRQSALNALVKMIKLDLELQACTLDAMFRIGVMKTFLPDALPTYTDGSPYIADSDLPFAERVSLDNWVHDSGANDIRRAGFMADTYLVTMEDAKDNGLWGSEFSNQLKPRQFTDEATWEKTEGLDQTSFDNDTDIDDMVRLCDVFLAREEMIVTLPCDENFKIPAGAKPFVREWDGLPCGPYHTLTFADVPDNAMPYSIAENLAGLAELYNNILAKMSHRALTQKDIFTYTSGEEEDARRFTQARDMAVVKVDAKDSVGVVKLGGIDGSLMAFDMNVMEIFSRAAGNIETMQGLGPVAPTASQEAQIGQAVNGRIAKMMNRVSRFASSIGQGLMDLIEDAPELTIPARREVGNGFDVDDSWYPPHLLERQGTPRDYELDVVPHSMEYRSPEQQLAVLNQNLQAIMPIYPLLEAQGVSIDGQALVKEYAELSHSPHFLRLFRFNGLPIETAEEDGTRLSQNQPREYIRKNVSGGATPAGRQHQQTQAMMNMADSGSGSSE